MTWTPDNGDGTFTNPLFYDEFSDPDLIRVGDWFYLTGTTMHAMPGVPILRSKDLVNWGFVAYALDKLDLGPAYRLEGGGNIYGQGIWAPSFRHHKGKFYIFANVNGQATQMFTATDPKGPWTRTPMKRSFHEAVRPVRRRRQCLCRLGSPEDVPGPTDGRPDRHRSGHRAPALRRRRRDGRGRAFLQDRRQVLHHQRQLVRRLSHASGAGGSCARDCRAT